MVTRTDRLLMRHAYYVVSLTRERGGSAPSGVMRKRRATPRRALAASQRRPPRLRQREPDAPGAGITGNLVDAMLAVRKFRDGAQRQRMRDAERLGAAARAGGDSVIAIVRSLWTLERPRTGQSPAPSVFLSISRRSGAPAGRRTAAASTDLPPAARFAGRGAHGCATAPLRFEPSSVSPRPSKVGSARGGPEPPEPPKCHPQSLRSARRLPSLSRSLRSAP